MEGASFSRWIKFLNFQLISSLFYVFLGSLTARKTESNYDNVMIFILFMGAIVLGLLGYGKSILQFQHDNRTLSSVVMISISIISHAEFLEAECKDTFGGVILGTVVTTLLLYYIFSC